jgi:glycosyltransferase involved in cell wall biosynthesis
MYPPHHLGGYELSCWDVMRRLEARGHHVEVLTTDMRIPGVAGDTVEAGERVQRGLRFYWDDHVLLSPPVWRRALTERHNQRVLRRVVEGFQPDVVSIWNMGAMSLGLLRTLEAADLPMVLSVCDDWLVYGPNLDAWMRLFVNRSAVGRAVHMATGLPTELPELASGTFCFVSDFIRQRALREGFARVVTSSVVRSGIETADFAPALAGAHPWTWRVLYVGRIDERKGLDTLVRAMAHLPPEATLEIVGRGDRAYIDHLQRLASDIGVGERVSYSVVDRDQLRDTYVAADVVVFPVVWDEPFGLVPVEAMACGVPVVATGTGGSGEFLLDGVNCVLFPPGDADGLARAVLRVASEDAVRRRLIEGGLATARELTVDRLADVLEAWHVAASKGFSDGRPAELPLLGDIAGSMRDPDRAPSRRED